MWEAVYIIEGLLKNTSDIQPDTVHADTQGQSLSVFGLGVLLGFDLLPRIRNRHDLVFYRPGEDVRYSHIDTLFGDEAVDWDLIETHWSDLLRTAISIRENRLSSVTLLRRLGSVFGPGAPPGAGPKVKKEGEERRRTRGGAGVPTV